MPLAGLPELETMLDLRSGLGVFSLWMAGRSDFWGSAPERFDRRGSSVCFILLRKA